MSPTDAALPETRRSSTVVLVREQEPKPEILLVLRHAKSAFGASYVFPGGVLESTDEIIGSRGGDLDDAAASTDDENRVDSCRFTEQRDALNDGSLLWEKFVADNSLQLAYDALHYFSFWVTPREMAKRFSTRFFIAEMPAHQEAEHCGGELTDSRWMPVAEAIAEHAAGKMDIPHPTVLTLQQLSEFDTIPSMLDWAKQRSEEGVPCYLPAIVTVDGQRQVVMPDSPNYPTYPPDR